MNAKTFEDQFNKAVGNQEQYKDWTSEGVYATVQLDKPVYKPGDTLEMRIF